MANDPMSMMDAFHHAVEALMTSGIVFIGHQFRKNRGIGQERDRAIGKLEVQVESMASEFKKFTRDIEQYLSRLTREVDQDRTATTLLKEAVHRMELELIRQSKTPASAHHERR